MGQNPSSLLRQSSCFDPFTLLLLRELVEEVAREVHAGRSEGPGSSAAVAADTRGKIARTIMNHALRGERDVERLRRAALDAVRG